MEGLTDMKAAFTLVMIAGMAVFALILIRYYGG